VAEASYYARRAARDEQWRKAQVAAARERKRRRRERDPETFRAAERKATARHHEKQRAHGLTYAEPWQRVGPRSGGD
jgi:hypothetical protein